MDICVRVGPVYVFACNVQVYVSSVAAVCSLLLLRTLQRYFYVHQKHGLSALSPPSDGLLVTTFLVVLWKAWDDTTPLNMQRSFRVRTPVVCVEDQCLTLDQSTHNLYAPGFLRGWVERLAPPFLVSISTAGFRISFPDHSTAGHWTLSSPFAFGSVCVYRGCRVGKEDSGEIPL